MTNQEIAKRIAAINWGWVHADMPDEGGKSIYLENALNNLPKEQAIEILLAVIEAISLRYQYGPNSPFSDLMDFNSLK